MTNVDLPKYDEFLAPIIRYSLDGKEHELSDTIEEMSNEFHLSDEQRNLLMSSGKRTYIYDRVSWAITYLVQAGLLERTGRSRYRISDEGKEEAKIMPQKVKADYLEKFTSFNEFRAIRHKKSIDKSNDQAGLDINSEDTPDEELDKIFEKRKILLKNDLLDTLLTVKPADFEKLIKDVVLALGYGKDAEEMAKVVGQPNDHGIDAEIYEDKLGFDKIYLQAKHRSRGESSISPHDVRDFVGALSSKKTKKGIFITTGKFTDEAKEIENASEYNIKLIDGEELAALMIEYMVGVRETQKYILKEIDKDYFESF